MSRDLCIAVLSLCGALLIGYAIYRKVNHNFDNMLDNDTVTEPTPMYHRPATIQCSSCHQEHPDWLFIHLSKSSDVPTPSWQPETFTTEQERRLAFVRWLIHAGRLTEWIIEEKEIEA